MLFRPPRLVNGAWVAGAKEGPLLELKDLPEGSVTQLCTMLTEQTGLPCVCASPPGGGSRWIVYTHGNAENLCTMYPHLQDASVVTDSVVISYELPGYFAGTEPSERACYDASERFVEAIKSVAPMPVVLMGYSMGCALALHAAEVHRGESFPLAVCLMCPFYSVAATQLGMTWSWLAAPFDRFKLKHSAIVQGHPIIVFTAGADEVTPKEQGEVLFGLAKENTHAVHVEVPGATHANLRVHEIVWKEIKEFLGEVEHLGKNGGGMSGGGSPHP